MKKQSLLLLFVSCLGFISSSQAMNQGEVPNVGMNGANINALLYGPPGLGTTMIARRIAGTDQLRDILLRDIAAGKYLPTEAEAAVSHTLIKTIFTLLNRMGVTTELQSMILLVHTLRNDVMPFFCNRMRRGQQVPGFMAKEIVPWVCEYTLAKVRKTFFMPIDQDFEQKIRQCVNNCLSINYSRCDGNKIV